MLSSASPYMLTSRLRLAILGLLVAVGIAGVAPLAASAATVNGACEDVEIPVALRQGQPASSVIAGTLCTPNDPVDAVTIDVMAPGGTYDRKYWDFPYQSPTYSFVERTLERGRATFAFDRIGSSESSTPPSLGVTFDTDVFTTHQAIQWLRDSRGYDDVTLIGHSAGSAAAVSEAARYDDVDRLVATGFLHSPSFNMILTMGTGLYPAALDPQFADRGLDLGYITLATGSRDDAFYTASADRAVIAYDEAHKSFMSLVNAQGAVAGILAPAALNESRQVTVPVLTIVGDHDILCGPPLIGVDCSSAASVSAYEAPFYSSAASHSAVVIPGTGHNLPLHPTADTSFDEIDRWIRSH